MRSAVENAAVEIIEERTGGVNYDSVAASLAADIVNRDTFTHEPDEAIKAGVEAAIEELDDATFDDAFDAVQAAVSAEIESQAKILALRMLRELAVKAQSGTAAAVG